jgi:mannose-1-phosphate guanylyltransferase
VAGAENTWAVILAGGSGTRLRSLTMDGDGQSVPKQYCSFLRSSTLIQDAAQRVLHVTDRPRLCTVVARQHARWWETAPASIPRGNVIVEPANRGTAHGILLATLWIAARDPDAKIVFSPADHFVADERPFAKALERLVREIDGASGRIVLLGITPEDPDSELGYVVPRAPAGSVCDVESFVEKPTTELARHMVIGGALWNTFVFGATAASLLNVFRACMASELYAMEHALWADAAREGALRHFYEGCHARDFSRECLEGRESQLRLVVATPCGWSDLGTVTRIGKVLTRLADYDRLRTRSQLSCRPSWLDLAAAWARSNPATPGHSLPLNAPNCGRDEGPPIPGCGSGERAQQQTARTTPGSESRAG